MIEYNIDNVADVFCTGRGEMLPFQVIQSHQVHQSEVAVIRNCNVSRSELDGIDALITNLKDCAIGVRTADCVPVLLFDSGSFAIAAIHAGWRGTLMRISRKTLERMRDEFGTEPENVKALIGPSICSRCFQVGDEVATEFIDAGFNQEGILTFMGNKEEGNINTGHHIDLKEANRLTLVESGVRPENILKSVICTYEDDAFYSARRQGLQCGRNINAIILRNFHQ